MATETIEKSVDTYQEEDSWTGGKSPFQTSYGKIMIWYFLLSDAFTFAALLITYGALRFSSPTWPVPDFVFQSFPGGLHHLPLIFVTVMSFVLIISSVTMVRAVQEGHRENKNGVVFWLLLTVIGGAAFLGCQAWEWGNLIGKEHMSLHTNPFGTHTADGYYLNEDNSPFLDANGEQESFEKGDSYLIHKHDDHWVQRKMMITSGVDEGQVVKQAFGPKAFGMLFFCITGFHGFHVLTGVLFLLIIAVNAYSGLYVQRKNGYEMVEKIGLYWHFVDLVWVFVFLVFYLL